MNKIFVYGSLCNYTQLKEVLGRIPQNNIGTLNGFKRNNTATWKFYQNSKKNNKWFSNNDKFIKFQPSYLTLENDNTSKTIVLLHGDLIALTLEKENATPNEIVILTDILKGMIPVAYNEYDYDNYKVIKTTNGEELAGEYEEFITKLKEQ